MNNKKVLFIETITIFLSMFLFHNIYNWFPNFLTASFFPVNESLFEHLKLMFTTQIIISLIIYLILKLKKIKFSNYLLGLLISTIVTISLFFLIYLPIYNRFGENLFLTMSIYLITFIIGNIIFYLISKRKHEFLLNLISLVIISIIAVILIYFTFNPLKNDFFFDSIEEIYGIK
ncbi:MAG: DUF6512 family protein [Bacilli bacterium]